MRLGRSFVGLDSQGPPALGSNPRHYFHQTLGEFYAHGKGLTEDPNKSLSKFPILPKPICPVLNSALG